MLEIKQRLLIAIVLSLSIGSERRAKRSIEQKEESGNEKIQPVESS
jgi:hypothetical protein